MFWLLNKIYQIFNPPQEVIDDKLKRKIEQQRAKNREEALNMVVETDPNYWDCECDENYIHKKSVTLFCSVCKMTEDECSDSRPNEIKLYYKGYKK